MLWGQLSLCTVIGEAPAHRMEDPAQQKKKSYGWSFTKNNNQHIAC